MGHTATEVSRVKSKKTGKGLPMFFINVKKGEKNKEMYGITGLLHSVVTVEAPRKQSNEAPQCQRCQRYGYTKKHCHLSPTCVKCPNFHLTSDCPREDRDNEVKCVNCGDAQPAN